MAKTTAVARLSLRCSRRVRATFSAWTRISRRFCGVFNGSGLNFGEAQGVPESQQSLFLNASFFRIGRFFR
jgi:hypothetical protein